MLEDLKMSLSDFTFVMNYIVHKIIVLLKNRLIYLKDNFGFFFKEYGRLFFFFWNNFFSRHIMMESLGLEEEKVIKDITNLFRLKKN